MALLNLPRSSSDLDIRQRAVSDNVWLKSCPQRVFITISVLPLTSFPPSSGWSMNHSSYAAVQIWD